MKKYLFLLLIICQSCEFFQQKKTNANEIYQKELKKIDFKNVDQYPNFISCDSLKNNTEKNDCFYNTLTQFIYQNLDKKSFKKTTINTDSINIKVTILPNSKINFEAILTDTLTKKSIDSLLKKKLYFHPQAKPALKKGIAVTSYFSVPIKLK